MKTDTNLLRPYQKPTRTLPAGALCLLIGGKSPAFFAQVPAGDPIPGDVVLIVLMLLGLVVAGILLAVIVSKDRDGKE